MFKSISFSLIFWSLLSMMQPLEAQQKVAPVYTDARHLTLIGKAWENDSFYHRLDTGKYPSLPSNVKHLSTHSAGLAISFKTNSSTIYTKWRTSPKAPSDNMTGIAFEGMDLYILRDDRWEYAGVARPKTHDFTEALVVENMTSDEKTYLLFLPTYDETISLEIGIDSGATIEAADNPFKKNILIYGSSIVQGASASRPGLAYPAKLSRQTGYHFINLGFSGSAKMEPAVADMIAPLAMDAFILDCVPNPSPEELLQRTANFVQTIRKYHPNTPIITLQSVAREKGNFDQQVALRVALKDQYFKQEIEKLQQQDKNLYLVDIRNLLGDDQEGTTDGIHPNDLGFDRMLEKVRPIILEILKNYGI